jgi:CubicO group peptidase (beta-lactamase class C family)
MKSWFALCLICAAFTNPLSFSAESWPGETWQSASAHDAGLDASKLEQARDYALTAGGSGYITRGGKLILAWGDPHQRYDLKSSTKSFGSIALGLAIKDGDARLSDKAIAIEPALGVPPESNKSSGWLDKITLLDLASQTAGFEKPGGYTRLLFEPGTMWDYSDSGPNWLAECLTLLWHRDINDVMFERVFAPIGILPADLIWRKNAYRPPLIDGIPRREFGAGISANVDAMARVGLLMLRGGEWNGRPILTRDYVSLGSHPIPEHANLPVYKNSMKEAGPNAPRHYGLLWWNNADGTLKDVPKDAFWSWGLYDSIILVIPSLDIVATRAGKSWSRKENAAHYDVLKPFFEPIAAAVIKSSVHDRSKEQAQDSRPNINGVRWAPLSAVARQAKGSDNWPMTWADDDSLYTAYGDGNGFEPFTPEKLSLGFARIDGSAANFHGENLRAPSLEQFGNGKSGKKASGLICVQGVLYLWARNAGNSQLAWSSDHGRTWTWADWKFTNSFGCPDFTQFGQNNDRDRDGWAYIISPDANDAYTPASRYVLARVSVYKIRERAAYSFFRELSSDGTPQWTGEINERGPILTRPGLCYRPHATFVQPLNRILLVHAKPNEHSRDTAGKIDSRYHGGLTIYESRHPWGPFRIIYDTDEWDTAPGDSASIPAKWISPDGRTLHLVFSGEDSFSVREFFLTE